MQKSSVARGNLKVNGNVVDLDYKLKNGDWLENVVHRYSFLYAPVFTLRYLMEQML